MSFEKFERAALNYEPCAYPGSKLRFRGPRRSLEGDYVAFLGGTETYGKFIADPFVNIVERSLKLDCINLGWSNAGADVFLHDTGVMNVAQGARAVVLQLPCTQNMSNRYYKVHPRRNDRFVAPTSLMRKVFPDVDFSTFHFTRHLLRHLQRRMPERFALVRKELQTLWVSRIRLLICKIDRPVVLLWFSKRRPSQDNTSLDVSLDPALVTRQMVDAVFGYGAELVEVIESDASRAAGIEGMGCTRFEQAAAEELLGPLAHEDAAKELLPVLSRLLT